MKKNKGFSIIELMVVVTLVGIVMAMGMPTFTRMIERNHLKGAVLSLQDDLQWMRVQSIKQNCNLQASFNTTTWSYQIYQPVGRCSCPVGGTNCVIKTVSGTQFSGVTMKTPDFLTTPTAVAEFDFRRGEARRANNAFSNGGVTFFTNNYAARVLVSQSGRVRVCTPAEGSDPANRPSGTSGLPTMPNC